MSTVLERDPLLRAGHHPLKALARRAPQRLRDLHEPKVAEVRGEWIGCDEAAEVLGIGRTQMWRLADQERIDCTRCGTRAKDRETTVHAVGPNYLVLGYKLSKRWLTGAARREVFVNGQWYPVAQLTWDPPRARAGVKTQTVLWLAEPPVGIAPGQQVFVPEGKWGRPEYKFRLEDVQAYAEQRRAQRFARQAQAATRVLYDLLGLLPTGTLAPTLQGVVAEQQRGRRKLTHPLAGLH